MRNIVISGSSGLGKTFLEEELEKRNISTGLPKYFDRENRAGERKDKNISMSLNEWKSMEKEFFYTLEYNGHNYGWKESDKKEGRVTLAITLKDLSGFMKKNRDFLPVVLWIKEENIGLLEKRMRKRGESEEKIKERMGLAKKELREMEKYLKVVKKFDGLIFEIKDDQTIFEEIIPKIMSLD